MTRIADPPICFDRTEGEIRHRFLRHGPVAAHVALTSGMEPRVVVAFPAGNRGILLTGAPHEQPVGLDFAGPLVPLDPETDGVRGVLVPVVAEATVLRFAGAVLGNIRTIRDAIHGVKPPGPVARHAMIVTGPKHDRALAIERGDLDGRHVHAASIEPHDGSDVSVEVDGTIVVRAGADGLVRVDVVATCDATPLTPIPATRLLRGAGMASGARRAGTARDLEALAFLAYREKLLAGSWQYLTYFGRDTLLALALLAPVAGADLLEAGLGAVIDRLSAAGDVAHEETLGEYALLERAACRRAARRGGAPSSAPNRDWGRGRAAPLLDDKMVDDDFLLAPVLANYLCDVANAERAAAFLAAEGGRRLDAVRANLSMVADRARPYAASGEARDLVHLRPGVPVGNWRDSAEGLGGGRVPFDVNVALVPAALTAAARLWDHPLVGPEPGRAQAARDLAGAWAGAARHFAVTIDNATARARTARFAADQGLPNVEEALRAIGDAPVSFPAIALDADLVPIPVMHGDDSLVTLLTDPSLAELEGIARRLVDPFPAGLRLPGAGTIVANPAYAGSDAQASFTAGHYHGTVAWSWPHAAFAAGLARQLARPDLPGSTRTRLLDAQRVLWEGIDATADLRGTEFWSFAVRDGRYRAVPAQGAGIVNESNPVQLWSCTWLGVARPDLPGDA